MKPDDALKKQNEKIHIVSSIYFLKKVKGGMHILKSKIVLLTGLAAITGEAVVTVQTARMPQATRLSCFI